MWLTTDKDCCSAAVLQWHAGQLFQVDIHFHTIDICKLLSRFTFIHLCYDHLLLGAETEMF